MKKSKRRSSKSSTPSGSPSPSPSPSPSSSSSSLPSSSALSRRLAMRNHLNFLEKLFGITIVISASGWGLATFEFSSAFIASLDREEEEATSRKGQDFFIKLSVAQSLEAMVSAKRRIANNSRRGFITKKTDKSLQLSASERIYRRIRQTNACLSRRSRASNCFFLSLRGRPSNCGDCLPSTRSRMLRVHYSPCK